MNDYDKDPPHTNIGILGILQWIRQISNDVHECLSFKESLKKNTEFVPLIHIPVSENLE